MNTRVLVIVPLMFLASCTADSNLMSSQHDIDIARLSNSDVEDVPLYASLGKVNVTNIVVDFEELLDHRSFEIILRIGKMSFQNANKKFNLYPGIIFDQAFKLGYDESANPGLGGRLFLYVDRGFYRLPSIKFFNGNKPNKVELKSFYVRTWNSKPGAILDVYGDLNRKLRTEPVLLNEDLTKVLPKFGQEVPMLVFDSRIRFFSFVVDEIKYKDKNTTR